MQDWLRVAVRVGLVSATAVSVSLACSSDRQFSDASGGASASGGSTRGGSAGRGNGGSGTVGTGGSSKASGGAEAGGMGGDGSGGTTGESGGNQGNPEAGTAGAEPASGGSSAQGGSQSEEGGMGQGGSSQGGSHAKGGSAGAAGSVASGGSSSGGSTANGGSGGTPDVTPPTITSITPAQGTKGVRSDAQVKIVFSEAMDKASVATSLGVSTFTTADLTLAWSADAKTLTITPKGGFGYAAGSASISARSFAVTIVTSAKDAAGNALARNFTSNFFTLRRISTRLSGWPVAHWDTYGPSVGGSVASCMSSSETFQLGSWSGSVSSGEYFGYVVVDPSGLGDPKAITNVELAEFVGEQAAATGSFYPNGSVLLQKLAYGPIDNNILKLAVTAELGTYCTSAATKNPTLDITDAFSADLASKQLYRLRGTGGALGTFANFTCGGFLVNVTYLTP